LITTKEEDDTKSEYDERVIQMHVKIRKIEMPKKKNHDIIDGGIAVANVLHLSLAGAVWPYIHCSSETS